MTEDLKAAETLSAYWAYGNFRLCCGKDDFMFNIRKKELHGQEGTGAGFKGS